MENQASWDGVVSATVQPAGSPQRLILTQAPGGQNALVLDVLSIESIDISGLPTAGAFFHRAETDLILTFSNGGQVFLTGFFGEGEETGKALIGAGWQLTDFQLAAAIEDDTNAFQLAEGAEQVLPNENSIIMAFDTETGAFTTTNVERLQLSDRQEIGASDLDVSNRETITRTEAESAFETIGNTAPEADDVLAVAGENSATISLNAAYSDADTSNSHVFLIDTSGTLGQVTNNGDGTFSYD
ncbi:hypothetical protein E1180_02170, partial [Roseibium denhamense]